MHYADARCTCTEEFQPEHVYVYRGPCVVSGKPQEVRIPARELFSYRRGARLQHAMPSLSIGEREFLISGISAESWDSMFQGNTEEND